MMGATKGAMKATPADPAARREWRLVGLVTLGVLTVLTIVSFNGDRAASDGFLAGIGWRYLQGVVLTMLVFAIFALGLNQEFGQTGLLNFGHVAFLGVGAYAAAILSARLGPWDAAGPLAAVGAVLLIVIVAVAISIALALLLGLPTLRLREDYLAITTIGAAEILRLGWLNEQWLTNGPQGLSVRMPGIDRITDGWWATPFDWLGSIGINLDPYYAWLTLWAVLLFGGATWVLQRLAFSPWGRVVRAVRENEDVAAALGKNVFAIKLQSLVLGSILAALAGILYGWYLSFITPNTFLPILTFYGWVVLVAGGAGNHRGMLAGSVLLWGVFEAARQFRFLEAIGLASTSGPQQVLLVGLSLMLLMILRPWGVVGDKEVLRE